MFYTTRDLAASVGKLTGKDQEFAQSLIKQSERKALSDKQNYWVNELTKRARGEGQPKAIDIGDLKATIALFDKARTHLKFPKVLLSVGPHTVRLSVAGERAKQPGSINVASVARFGEGAWYGRITRDGVFVPTPAARIIEGLPEALKAFAADPAKVAADHGRLTGHCAFCNLPLRDERSVAVGFGPVCAERWGIADQWKNALKSW